MSAAVAGLNAPGATGIASPLDDTSAVAAEARPRSLGRVANAASKEQCVRIQNAREEVRKRGDRITLQEVVGA